MVPHRLLSGELLLPRVVDPAESPLPFAISYSIESAGADVPIREQLISAVTDQYYYVK
jgi:hypothetical protein